MRAPDRLPHTPRTCSLAPLRQLRTRARAPAQRRTALARAGSRQRRSGGRRLGGREGRLASRRLRGINGRLRLGGDCRAALRGRRALVQRRGRRRRRRARFLHATLEQDEIALHLLDIDVVQRLGRLQQASLRRGGFNQAGDGVDGVAPARARWGLGMRHVFLRGRHGRRALWKRRQRPRRLPRDAVVVLRACGASAHHLWTPHAHNHVRSQHQWRGASRPAAPARAARPGGDWRRTSSPRPPWLAKPKKKFEKKSMRGLCLPQILKLQGKINTHASMAAARAGPMRSHATAATRPRA